MAREACTLELLHAKQADTLSSVSVLVTVNSFEVIDEVMKNGGDI